jgi:hypothetical protein
MVCCKLYLLLVFSLMFSIKNLPAQNITGTWQGDLGNNQFLQVNVIQVKDKLCGYTWDYVYKNKKSYCKAYFTGVYNKKRKEWILDGSSFIVDSIGHLLMKITLWEEKEDGKIKLIGYEDAKNDTRDSVDDLRIDMDDGFSINMADTFPKLFVSPFQNSFSYIDIALEKVSEMPSMILDNMKDCFGEYLKQKSDDLKTVTPKTTSLNKLTDQEIISPIIIDDTLKIKDEKDERTTKELTHIIVNTKKITLNVYDNALIDGDTVTIFYNDRVLLSHQRLSEKPITINIDLDEKDPFCKIVLFAENLGSIPPNTALIVVMAGNKRYELFSSASLTENAMLLFEYKPNSDQ